jgi:lysyl-tRNA synthetase class I
VTATYRDLFEQDRSQPHWAYDYAARLAGRHPPGHRILIQTSMSPSGRFHLGNFRDTTTAHLVHRALLRAGRDSAVLLSFDDYDPGRSTSASAHRPLGSAPGARAICRRYLQELVAAGICPVPPDAAGETPPHPRWATHYQHERYRAGTYTGWQRRYQKHARTLAGLLGSPRPEALFSPYCAQCGRNTTEVLSLRETRVRYACRSCGAVVSTVDLGTVKPSWALDWTLRVAAEDIDCEPAGQDHCTAGSTMDRTRPLYKEFLRRPQPVIVPYGVIREPGARRKVSGSRGGGATVTDLLAVLPARMVLWLYGRRNCLSDFRVGFGAAEFHGYYDEYDRFVARAAAGERRARALWDLLSDAPPGPPLPRFRTLVGRLHSAGYDLPRVLATVTGAEAAERVRHAHAWLSGPGRGSTWVAGPAGTGVYGSLFGTASGPPLRRLDAQYGAGAVEAAVAEHAATGRRPLLDRVLSALDGPVGMELAGPGGRSPVRVEAL